MARSLPNTNPLPYRTPNQAPVRTNTCRRLPSPEMRGVKRRHGGIERAQFAQAQQFQDQPSRRTPSIGQGLLALMSQQVMRKRGVSDTLNSDHPLASISASGTRSP